MHKPWATALKGDFILNNSKPYINLCGFFIKNLCEGQCLWGFVKEWTFLFSPRADFHYHHIDCFSPLSSYYIIYNLINICIGIFVLYLYSNLNIIVMVLYYSKEVDLDRYVVLVSVFSEDSSVQFELECYMYSPYSIEEEIQNWLDENGYIEDVYSFRSI